MLNNKITLYGTTEAHRTHIAQGTRRTPLSIRAERAKEGEQISFIFYSFSKHDHIASSICAFTQLHVRLLPTDEYLHHTKIRNIWNRNRNPNIMPMHTHMFECRLHWYALIQYFQFLHSSFKSLWQRSRIFSSETTSQFYRFISFSCIRFFGRK